MSPRLQPEQLEPGTRGEAVHRQRRRLDERDAVRNRHDRGGRYDQKLLLGAALGPPRTYGGHHLIPDPEPVDVGADRLDDPGRVHSRNPRRGEVSASALAEPDIGRVDRRGLDSDPDLAGAGLTRGAVDDLKDIRVPRLGDDDGAQDQTSCVGVRALSVGVGAMTIDA